MVTFLYYLFVILALAAVAIVIGLFVRGYMTGTSPAAGLFGPRAERRLDIVEQSTLDGRRKLVLVRRDDVEHLIMTGGPIDVVIETNIAAGAGQARRHSADEPLAATPVYTRPARTLSQVGAGDKG